MKLDIEMRLRHASGRISAKILEESRLRGASNILKESHIRGDLVRTWIKKLDIEMHLRHAWERLSGKIFEESRLRGDRSRKY